MGTTEDSVELQSRRQALDAVVADHLRSPPAVPERPRRATVRRDRNLGEGAHQIFHLPGRRKLRRVLPDRRRQVRAQLQQRAVLRDDEPGLLSACHGLGRQFVSGALPGQQGGDEGAVGGLRVRFDGARILGRAGKRLDLVRHVDRDPALEHPGGRHHLPAGPVRQPMLEFPQRVVDKDRIEPQVHRLEDARHEAHCHVRKRCIGVIDVAREVHSHARPVHCAHQRPGRGIDPQGARQQERVRLQGRELQGNGPDTAAVREGHRDRVATSVAVDQVGALRERMHQRTAVGAGRPDLLFTVPAEEEVVVAG